MLYSTTCEYAIRALTYLASRPVGTRVSVADIAQAERLPAPFLGKICKDLVRAGVLESARGPSGGYALAAPPSDLTLLRIKEVVDGSTGLERCAVGLDPCSDATPCPLHDTWKPLRLKIGAYLESTTLEDMADGVRRKRALLQGEGAPLPESI